jgi:hypothetical protein
MTEFPWDIAIGLGIVLLGTLLTIVWVLAYDHLENANAVKEGHQSKGGQQQHPHTNQGRP